VASVTTRERDIINVNSIQMQTNNYKISTHLLGMLELGTILVCRQAGRNVHHQTASPAAQAKHPRRRRRKQRFYVRDSEYTRQTLYFRRSLDFHPRRQKRCPDNNAHQRQCYFIC